MQTLQPGSDRTRRVGRDRPGDRGERGDEPARLPRRARARDQAQGARQRTEAVEKERRSATPTAKACPSCASSLPRDGMRSRSSQRSPQRSGRARRGRGARGPVFTVVSRARFAGERRAAERRLLPRAGEPPHPARRPRDGLVPRPPAALAAGRERRTASRGRCSPRSTRSSRTSAATWARARPARSAGCSSCRRPGMRWGTDAQRRRHRRPVEPGGRDLLGRALPRRGRRPHRHLARPIFAYNHADWYVDEMLSICEALRANGVDVPFTFDRIQAVPRGRRSGAVATRTRLVAAQSLESAGSTASYVRRHAPARRPAAPLRPARAAAGAPSSAGARRDGALAAVAKAQTQLKSAEADARAGPHRARRRPRSRPGRRRSSARPSTTGDYVFPVGGGPVPGLRRRTSTTTIPRPTSPRPRGRPSTRSPRRIVDAWHRPIPACGIGLTMRDARRAQWTYCHLSFRDPAIQAGAVFAPAPGRSRRLTGHATGPHLHLGLQPRPPIRRTRPGSSRSPEVAFTLAGRGALRTCAHGRRACGPEQPGLRRPARRSPLRNRLRRSASSCRGLTRRRFLPKGTTCVPGSSRVIFVVVLAVLVFTRSDVRRTAVRGHPGAAGDARRRPRQPQVLIVPEVRGQAFVFAKGMIQDAGFAWHVTGAVDGYAVDTVATQTPDGRDARRRHGRADPDPDADAATRATRSRASRRTTLRTRAAQSGSRRSPPSWRRFRPPPTPSTATTPAAPKTVTAV